MFEAEGALVVSIAAVAVVVVFATALSGEMEAPLAVVASAEGLAGVAPNT